MSKRKREEINKKQQDDETNEIQEALEEKISIDDDPEPSSEGEGDDLLEDMEK